MSAAAACAWQRTGPWDRAGTHYFYGGALSNFAPVPGLRLPEGWFGHPRPARPAEALSVEHYFQACKAQSHDDFRWVLGAPDARRAKYRGSPGGEDGRKLILREDWERVKVDVMRVACRAKFSRPPFRRALLGTGARPLVEDSPRDFYWGGRDRSGGYSGRNLLGLVLMEIRAELGTGFR